MGTVSKKIADDVIAGLYDDDKPLKIVKYQNAFDGTDNYGLICKGDSLDRYAASSFVINPIVYWINPKYIPT
jgi:hypothetical protein